MKFKKQATLKTSGMNALDNSPADKSEVPDFISKSQFRLENLLLQGLESGPSTRMTPKDWKELRERVRRGMKRAH